MRQHTLRILENLVVPKSQRAKAARRQNPGTVVVKSRSISVLAAIDFDHESCFEANKINHEARDRKLSAKLGAKQAAPAKMFPQGSFGIRQGQAQLSCTLNILPHLHAPPSPAPSARPLPPAGEAKKAAGHLIRHH